MIELKKAHKDFLRHLQKESRSKATIIAYGKDIEQLIDFLKELEKTRSLHVRKENLQAFMAKLEKEGYTPKSVSRKTNSTKTFFRFLKINEYITDDPAVLISHPKFENPPPRILSQTEYRALRDACRDDIRTSAVVELLLQTGIRIGELSRIKLEDVKFGSGGKDGELIIHLYEKHEGRTIPLNQAVQKALERYLEIRPKSQNKTFFVTKTGKPLLVRNIRTVIARHFKLAGIKDAKVNDLRHTFIAHHLMKGTSLLLLSKLAGHKRLATTEKYLKHVKAAFDESFKLEAL